MAQKMPAAALRRGPDRPPLRAPLGENRGSRFEPLFSLAGLCPVLRKSTSIDSRIETYNAGVARLANRFRQPVQEHFHANPRRPYTILPSAGSLSRSAVFILFTSDSMSVLKQTIELSFDDAAQQPVPVNPNCSAYLMRSSRLQTRAPSVSNVRVLPSKVPSRNCRFWIYRLYSGDPADAKRPAAESQLDPCACLAQPAPAGPACFGQMAPFSCGTFSLTRPEAG